MAKALIIKDADFSTNAIELRPFADVLPTKKSQFGVFYLDYNGTVKIRQTNDPAAATMKILVADVSAYIGRTVRITSANNVIAGAYYACFTMTLGDLSFSDIPNLAGGSGNVDHPFSVIESFNVSSTDLQSATITKTIPNGAVYLVVTGNFAGDLTETNFKAELV